MTERFPAVVIPGIQGSGPSHWQSLWQAAEPDWVRIAPSSWDEPELEDWMRALDVAVDAAIDRSSDSGTTEDASTRPTLIAHSLGCSLVAHWASRRRRPIGAALLVAPPDPTAASFPNEARTFIGVPMDVLPFPTILAASSDDPYCSIQHARAFAFAWGAQLVELGALGHVNAASNLGEWPFGRALLERTRRIA